MKKLTGEELAKEIGCDAGTLKKTCKSSFVTTRKRLTPQSTTTTITPRTLDLTLSTRR